MKQAEQKQESVIQAGNLNKKYGDFQLSIPRLEIPRGFATALIGENGGFKIIFWYFWRMCMSNCKKIALGVLSSYLFPYNVVNS